MISVTENFPVEAYTIGDDLVSLATTLECELNNCCIIIWQLKRSPLMYLWCPIYYLGIINLIRSLDASMHSCTKYKQEAAILVTMPKTESRKCKTEFIHNNIYYNTLSMEGWTGTVAQSTTNYRKILYWVQPGFAIWTATLLCVTEHAYRSM